MIQINLSTAKKNDLAKLGGLDLSKLKVKWVVLAIAAVYLPDFTIRPHWEEQMTEVTQRVDSLTSEKNNLSRKVEDLKDFDKQIQTLNKQEEKLKAKLEVVKSILSKRQNPWEILVYVAKNVPTDLWLTDITFEGKKIVFKGLSIDYTPQGVFLENIKKSIFFDKNVVYSKADSKGPVDQKNLAPFEITATILGFN